MTSNQRSPMWPYLLVLGSLFALSLAIPHGWQAENDIPRDRAYVERPPFAFSGQSLPSVSIVRPATISTPLSTTLESNWKSRAQGQNSLSLQTANDLATTADQNPSAGQSLVERVAQKITSSRVYGMAQSFLFHSDPTTGNADDAGIADDDVPPAPPVGLANAAVGNRPRMAIAAIPSVPTPVQRIPGVPTLAARPPRPATLDRLARFV